MGHKIAVVGKLDTGKAGWWLSFEGWGLYIKTTTTNNADLAKFEQLNRFRLHTVKAVGTLRHENEWTPKTAAEQGVPENFFFDAAEVTVTESTNASPKFQR